jgi:hypothetical protein
MKYLSIEIASLRSPEYLGEEPLQRATWLNLLSYCVAQENRGVIEGCGEWKDRMWQQVCGITAEEAGTKSSLWRWEGANLIVMFYPHEAHDFTDRARESGRAGGKAKAERVSKQPSSDPTSTPTRVALAPALPNVMKGNVMKGKEIKEKVADAPVAFPQVLDCDEFKVHWDAYIAYRKEAKLKALKPVSVTRQLAEMATWGVERSIQAINTTIAKGWQGIFEPKAGFGTPKPDSTPRKADGSIDYYADAVAVFGEENVVRVAAL